MCDAAKLRALNDAFRHLLSGGKVLVTPGVLALPDPPAIMQLVQNYTDFNEGNDPYGEHDFGSFTLGNQQVFWKIDASDCRFEFGSPNPCDPAVTARVLTIMLAEEY